MQPVTGYSHDEGCSITGGFVYRGSTAPELRGGYVFADYCSGSTWVLDAEAKGFVAPTQVAAEAGSISTFGEDEAGELYVIDHGGAVYRLTGSGSASG